ncbi:hypothetical protein MTO96_008118 [Rhipicephalus appendiculatus]
MWTLRDLGFGKSVVEDKLAIEFRNLEEEIEKSGREGGVPWIAIHGVRRKPAGFLLHASDTKRQASVVSFLPFTKVCKMNNAIKNFDNFIINEISNHVEGSGQKSFIQTYTDKVNESTKDQDYTYQHRYLVGHIKMFLIGGIDGPSISMQMHMVMFAARPNDLQRRVQREIDAVIGKRSCPGEPFALMQIFLMVTYTLQRYNVELGEPLACDLDDPAIDLGVLKKMRLRFERRFKNTITCNGVRQ